MDLSIIIPVYNTSRYIKRCIDSIERQLLKINYEILVVDDGSTDNGLQIIEKLAKSNPCIKILIHKRNLGLACARRTGIEAAVGDYIIHVDSDDVLLPNTLQHVWEVCNREKCEILVYSYIRFFSEAELSRNKATYPNGFYLPRDKAIGLFYGTCINKMVRRDILYEMDYGHVRLSNGEDFLYSMEILARVNQVYVYPLVVYGYYYNEGSLVNATELVKLMDSRSLIFKLLEKLSIRYKKEHPVFIAGAKYLMISLCSIYRQARYKRKIEDQHIKVNRSLQNMGLKKWVLIEKWAYQYRLFALFIAIVQKFKKAKTYGILQ